MIWEMCEAAKASCVKLRSKDNTEHDELCSRNVKTQPHCNLYVI